MHLRHPPELLTTRGRREVLHYQKIVSISKLANTTPAYGSLPPLMGFPCETRSEASPDFATGPEPVSLKVPLAVVF